MMYYITCEKRKNAPKINVLICEKKCKKAKSCISYLNYCKTHSPSTPADGYTVSGEELINIESPHLKKIPPVAAGN